MITAIAPTNIAILKYWGKNPDYEDIHIPTKSSLSFTVDGLHTITTVEAKKGKGKVRFSLNRMEIAPQMKEHEYVRDFIEKVGRFYPSVKGYDYRIVSENNFPTAAGFASSASGFAALIKAISGEVKELASKDEKVLSALARLGSGSATRSIPSKGGFVEWRRGLTGRGRSMEEMSMSSYAETLFPPDHWPELSIIYAKVRAEEKKIKSRAGMMTSVSTNPLYESWVSYEEGELRKRMIGAMKERDFPALAELTMKASNNLHQICMGTYPPIVYLNGTSLSIIEGVHDLNEDGIKAAYTFDAGPNAVLFCQKKDENEVISLLSDLLGRENILATKMGPGAVYSDKHLL